MRCFDGDSGILTFQKVLQDQQKFHHMAVDLAEVLNVRLHLSDIIPEKLQQGSVQKSLKSMMDIIEETLEFIQAHLDSHSISELCLNDVIFSVHLCVICR